MVPSSSLSLFPPVTTITRANSAAYSTARSVLSTPSTTVDSSSVVTYKDKKQLLKNAVNVWFCHCCTAKNLPAWKTCHICGRSDDYASSGYHLPFHGETGKLYRPTQIINVLEDIHEVDSEKWTALHSACANGNTAIVKRLLDYKAEIEAITEKGWFLHSVSLSFVLFIILCFVHRSSPTTPGCLFW
jgi:ankyrin repeat protein